MTPIIIDDLDNVEAWKASGGAPIPPGKHLAEIEDIEEAKASTGSPQVIIKWRVVDGPYAGHTSREWLVILPQTYGKVKAFLLSVGWALKPGRFEMPVRELIGRRAQIVVGSEFRDGKQVARVLGHLPLDESDVPIDTAGLPRPSSAELPF